MIDSKKINIIVVLCIISLTIELFGAGYNRNITTTTDNSNKTSQPKAPARKTSQQKQSTSQKSPNPPAPSTPSAEELQKQKLVKNTLEKITTLWNQYENKISSLSLQLKEQKVAPLDNQQINTALDDEIKLVKYHITKFKDFIDSEYYNSINNSFKKALEDLNNKEITHTELEELGQAIINIIDEDNFFTLPAYKTDAELKKIISQGLADNSLSKLIVQTKKSSTPKKRTRRYTSAYDKITGNLYKPIRGATRRISSGANWTKKYFGQASTEEKIKAEKNILRGEQIEERNNNKKEYNIHRLEELNNMVQNNPTSLSKKETSEWDLLKQINQLDSLSSLNEQHQIDYDALMQKLDLIIEDEAKELNKTKYIDSVVYKGWTDMLTNLGYIGSAAALGYGAYLGRDHIGNILGTVAPVIATPPIGGVLGLTAAAGTAAYVLGDDEVEIEEDNKSE